MARSPSIVVAALLASATPAARAEEPAYKLIVHADNPVSVIRREQAAILFLSRGAAWAHGPAAEAIDQSMTSKVREAFSREILGLELPAVQNYWRKRLLEAREMPPKVKETDAEVIAHVAKHSGGIGYVSAAAELPAGVKVLRVADPLR
jgi:ABC-type phosphate transport system substrate-binding protein